MINEGCLEKQHGRVLTLRHATVKNDVRVPQTSENSEQPSHHT